MYLASQLVCDCPDYTGKIAGDKSTPDFLSQLISRDWSDSPNWQSARNAQEDWYCAHIWAAILDGVNRKIIDPTSYTLPKDYPIQADLKPDLSRPTPRIAPNPQYGDYVGFDW